MYGWTEMSGQWGGRVTRPISLLFLVFALVFAFGVIDGMLETLLRLGFFHGLLGLFGTLGTGRSALFALFLLQLLAAQQLNKRFIGAIAFLPTSADDTQVTAFAVPETRSHGVEKLAHRRLGHQVRPGLATRGKVSALAQRNHFFRQRTQGLGLGHGGFDTLFDNERSHQVPQQ